MTNSEYSWNENPKDICSVKRQCPECKNLVMFEGFHETGCEDCGSHSAVKCPECGEYFDHVWGYGRIRSFNNISKDEPNQ